MSHNTLDNWVLFEIRPAAAELVIILGIPSGLPSYYRQMPSGIVRHYSALYPRIMPYNPLSFIPN